MFETLPVSLTAFFTVDEIIGHVRITGDNYPHLALTLIQQGMWSYCDEPDKKSQYTISYTFRGDEASPKIEVQDKDVLIVLARTHGSIIASQVYEVDLSMPYSTGYLLIPRGGYTAHCSQEFMTEAELAGLKCNRLTIDGPVFDVELVS